MAQAEKQRIDIQRKVAGSATSINGEFARPATQVADFTAKGEIYRRVRVKFSAAQVDVAALANVSHTIVGERENGISGDDRHDQRIRKALRRIGHAKLRNIVEGLEELEHIA